MHPYGEAIGSEQLEVRLKSGLTMQYMIDLSEDKSYIILKYVGDITSQLALIATEESHALGSKYGIRHYLVDATEAKNFENPFKNYNFAYQDLERANIDRAACVALLTSAEDTTHDFIETLMVNAGYDVKLFKNRENAIQHLLAAIREKDSTS
jgi:hypothetical protein